MRTKVCYVLPLYDEATEQHYAHLYRLLERAGRELRLLVIAEKSKGPIRLENVHRAWRQRFRFPPLRALELVSMLLCARVMGYRTFYTHYSFYGGVLAGILARITGGRSFYWNCEENIGHHVRPTSLANLKKLLLTQWPETTAIKLAKPLVTGTARMRDYYAKHYRRRAENIRVMPNWVDPRRFADASPDKELTSRLDAAGGGPRVLYLHRLAPRKGAHHLGRLAECAAKDHPEVLFVVAGDGPSRRDVAEDFRARGLDRRLLMLGKVPNRRVAGLMKLVDVMVMPSEQEGFPRVLIEAMAAGLPFVATNVGGVMDVVAPEQAQYVAPRGDVEMLGEMLSRLLGDADARRELSRVGLERINDFATEVALERFLEMVST